MVSPHFSTLSLSESLNSVNNTPSPKLYSQWQDLYDAVSPSIVILQTLFDGPENPETRISTPLGVGVFISPTLILTSARMVGRVSTIEEFEWVEKSDTFEAGRVRYRSFIGKTTAMKGGGGELVMKTTPIAVNFGRDLAVLKVVKPEDTQFPHCSVVSRSDPIGSDLLAMPLTYRHEFGTLCMNGFVRLVKRENQKVAKAPWPINGELPWISHSVFYYRGDPFGRDVVGDEVAEGVVTWNSGTPWFNLDGEIVGISSWQVPLTRTRPTVGYSVPAVCINEVVEYAKNKGEEDPIVMDSWFDSHVIPGVDDFDVVVEKHSPRVKDFDWTIGFIDHTNK